MTVKATGRRRSAGEEKVRFGLPITIVAGRYQGVWLQYKTNSRDSDLREGACERCLARVPDVRAAKWFYRRDRFWVRSRQLCGTCVSTVHCAGERSQ